MKKLAILRHAKSAWSLPGEGDESRRLNDRGHEQLGILSGWLDKSGFTPDHIICSTATRTRETLGGLSHKFDTSKAEFDANLYLTSIDAYLDTIWGAPDCETLLIIGHNPTCDELVRYLANSGSPAMETLLLHHFSTGTLAIMELDVAAWSQVSRAKGQLTHFLRPKLIQEGAF
ncbi:SixA phosphatase family protein [Pseudahrensia aquimaris]|uniref:SixA phosphatase family protein n=1 Tax=Pseudahrensia aquimaris TaxID=744461 RepID=A0ABW3FJV8_9HYPH